VIALLVSKLEARPHIAYEIAGHEIYIPSVSATGFDIAMREERNETIVMFGNGAHEHMHDVEDAVGLVGAGIIGDVRLRIHWAGKFEYRWTVEERDDANAWVDRKTTGLIFYPYWWRKTVAYAQNHVSLKPV